MNEGRNTLLKFLGGLALLIAGLVILFQRVYVGGSYFGFGGLAIGSFRVPSGLIVIPFIIGVVWMFGSGGSFASKFFTAVSVLVIIIDIIMNTRIHFEGMSLLEWLIVLVMIFGGGAIVARILFSENGSDKEKVKAKKEAEEYKNIAAAESQRARDLEKELESFKKKVDEQRNA